MYKNLRLKGVKFPEKHLLDDMRLIQHNLPVFAEMPILDNLDSEFPGENEWLLRPRRQEPYKVFGGTFILLEMIDKNLNKEEFEKVTFMFHYLMNFRSRMSKNMK